MKKVLAAPVLLVGIVGWYIVWYSSDPAVVTIYDDRFEPAELTISVGERVVFVSAATEPVWPASNEHPSHGLYPEFDTKDSLAPGEKWEFVFDQPGIWQFHDHLAAKKTGTISVRDTDGTLARGCFNAWEGTARASCWETDFASLIAEGGIDAALDEFNRHQAEPEFARYCHDIMHYVGRAAYQNFRTTGATVTRSETAECGYGYYHGFIEASLEHSGATGLQVAKEYCAALALESGFDSSEVARNASRACMHGIGHAIFDSTESRHWGDMRAMTLSGVRQCDELYESDRDAAERCRTGVFNSLATALNNHYYDLAQPDSIEPLLTLCADEAIPSKPYCYLDLLVSFARYHEFTLAEKLDLVRQLSDEEGEAMVLYGMLDDGYRAETAPDLRSFAAFCEGIAEDHLQRACVLGVTTGIMMRAEQSEMLSQLTTYCSYITSPNLQQTCYADAASMLRASLPDELYALSCHENTAIAPYCVN